MSAEFGHTSEEQHENHPETHYQTPISESAAAFQTGPEETTLTPTDRRATDLVPQYQERQPAVTVRERPGIYEQSVRACNENGEIVLLDEEQAFLQRRVGRSIEHWQQKLLENFEPQREGLNLERGDAFVKSLGLAATTTTLELPGEMRGKVDTVYPLGPNAKFLNGKYLAWADMAVTFRDPPLEELNGPEYTEMIRIHELVHSSQDQHWYFKIENGEVSNAAQLLYAYNNSLEDQDAGTFFSEGVPEMVASQYVTEVLGKPHGLLDLTESKATSTYSALPIPSRYLILNQFGKQDATGQVAYAAVGLEELTARDPALRPALIGGMYDDEARAEVAGRINAISPGLFERLNHNPDINKSQRFGKGLGLIRILLRR